MSELRKILLAGIDNAGKSSIIHILKKNYSFLNKLKPTKGIERTSSKVLGIDFVIWDMGGQEQYIKQYFERKDFIFNELSLLFFVVDMQDAERFDNTLSYFDRIISAFKEFQQSPNIIIFFHKVDPDIEHSSEIELYIKDLTKKIRISAEGFNVAFFETSIFRRWSIIGAFSYGIRSLFEEHVAKISDYLRTWADTFGATAAQLMTVDDVVISDFSRDSESAVILNQYVEELRKIYAVSQKPVIIKLDGDFLTLNPLRIGDFSLHLIKYTNNPNISEADFTKPIPEESINDVKDVLANFFRKFD